MRPRYLTLIGWWRTRDYKSASHNDHQHGVRSCCRLCLFRPHFRHHCRDCVYCSAKPQFGDGLVLSAIADSDAPSTGGCDPADANLLYESYAVSTVSYDICCYSRPSDVSSTIHGISGFSRTKRAARPVVTRISLLALCSNSPVDQ